MQAAAGDRLRVRGHIVGQSERIGEIVEVRGAGGESPYLVRFDDGHTSLVFPGPDAVIEHSGKRGKKRPAEGRVTGAKRRAFMRGYLRDELVRFAARPARS